LDVKENTLAAYENQDYPFDQLVGELTRRNHKNNQLRINAILVSENVDIMSREILPPSSPDLTITPYRNDFKMAKFDLSLVLGEEDSTLILEFEYNEKVFKKQTIQNMAAHFMTILKQVIEDPGIRIWDINIQSEEEEACALKEEYQSPAVVSRKLDAEFDL
jgi:non-ribosomal peptide synthetase component F